MGFEGSKYESKRDVKDVAKLVRADLAALVKKGELPKGFKASVTIDRFSGGCSLDVRVTAAPGVPIYNRERLLLDTLEPNAYHHGAGVPPLNTEEATALIKLVEGVVNAYRRDNSDLMTDYFDVSFYSDVKFDWSLEKADREAALAEIKAKIEADKAALAAPAKPASLRDRLAAAYEAANDNA